jgi:methyl-accepting chemotaxis protein
MKLSLGVKIGGGFACIMLGALVLGFTGITALTQLQHAVEDNGGIIEVRRMMYDARLAATRYLAGYREEEAEACHAEVAKVRHAIDVLIPELEAGEAASLTQMAALLDAYEERMRGVQKSVAQAREKAGSQITVIPEVADQVKAWRASGVELVNLLGATTTAVAERMHTVSRRASATLVICVPIVMVLSALLAWRITRNITRPVHDVRTILTALATGDLTRRTTVHSGDEVGDMAKDLDTTVAGLRSMVGSISQEAQGIASAAEELNTVSVQLTSSASTVSARSESVAASATEVSQSISTFASGVEEMNASVIEISKNASQAATVAREGVATSVRAQTAMTSLEKSSLEIGEIVKMITSIAEQTNLLALNATIEAARAGDAGRGFAVVAGEVKDLARKTAEATADIRNRVGGIQHDTKEATTAIRQLSDIADRVSALQQSIASAVEEQSATTRELSGNIAQVSQGGTEIAKNIVAVAEAAKAASDGARGTHASAQGLSTQSAELQQIIARFKMS